MSSSSSSSSSSYSPKSAFQALASPGGRGSGISDFLNSNSLVAKLSFLLMVIFIFIIVTRLSIALLSWSMGGGNVSRSHIFDGMVPGNQFIVINQDPSLPNANQIARSINTTEGIEFTWSVWLFINSMGSSHKYQHIFHKGNANFTDSNSNGLNFPNNAPGLYISPNTNELTVVMNTYDVITEEILVPDIPLNKWVNVIIRCRNTTMDVYINGFAVKSAELTGVPKQNYGDVYVAMNGGFDGYISNLWYYNYALGTAAIQSLVKGGPNNKLVGTSGLTSKASNYLSMKWYFYGNGDQYNP
jgi:hypothetical protein